MQVVTESAIAEWTGHDAVVQSLLTGTRHDIPADAPVLSAGKRADPTLADDLAARGISATAIGDVPAPRLAAAGNL